MTDSNFLSLPRAGDFQLRIISPNVVELFMVTTKDEDPAPVTTWTFIDSTGNGSIPASSTFNVSANGQNIPVDAVGFKRRVLYAPLRTRDLRIANSLYLRLTSPIPANAVVNVQDVSGSIWNNSVTFIATNSPNRYSPAVHVNQAGYGLSFPKKAMVGYYLGTLGELAVPTNGGFQVINAVTEAVVLSGPLKRRPDIGYTYTPKPYQNVYEADFGALTTPGEYKVLVPGMGTSFPIHVDDGIAATFAKTYALGIYHQRCGTDNSMPFTRYTHGPCHTNLVLIPSAPGPEQDFVNNIVNQESAGAVGNPRHTAPRLVNVNASLYPFVNTGLIDASGGHHDAGDYSKYTTSVSAFIHSLTFAADALPGVKNLDNLGIPESGDGISDILQEAKWEADYLAKLQDADGGFYFIVYPRNRQYELDVLPDHGDLQLVLPKNTSATAAAVAALAELASSPTFKAAYPAAAANYLAKAQLGWTFLQNAIAAHGRDGAYQMVTFSSDTYMHDDELAWAAAALFVATGDPVYDAELRSHVPNPNDQELRRWSWWSMFGPYGCAFRTYAFAARTGRLLPSQLDSAYVAKCEAEIRRAATNSMRWSDQNAYGSSFVEESKSSRLAGWFFSGEWTFDPAVAYALEPRPEYLDTILKDFNYEMGCNPVNVTYLTGLGWKRQREIVHQYALNDNHVLPPNGIPLGNIQAGYDYLQLYKGELNALSYPSDSAPSATYPYYDRWADTFNVSTEFVVSQTAKTLPAAAMLMAMTSASNEESQVIEGQILGMPTQIGQSGSVTGILVAAGFDLAKARILWEASDQEPYIGRQFRFTPGYMGTNWVEAEALLPNGDRVVARTNFFAMPTGDVPRTSLQSEIVALYRLQTDLTDATGKNPPLAPSGGAAIDPVSLHVNGLGDHVQVYLPNTSLVTPGKTKAIAIEARLFVNAYKGYTVSSANILSFVRSWDHQVAVQQDKWKPSPDIKANGDIILDGSVLTNSLTLRQWHLLNITLDENAYVVRVDGNEVARKYTDELAYWGGGGQTSLQLGEFDGWITEIVVWNLTNSLVVTPPPPPPPAPPPTNGTVVAPMNRSDDGHFHFSARAQDGIAFVLKASTDLTNWVPLFTNFFGGVMDYIDTRSKELPRRYYQAVPLGDVRPSASTLASGGTGDFRVRFNGMTGIPFGVQVSTNLIDWEEVYVNNDGGLYEFVDTNSKQHPRRFYRGIPKLTPVAVPVPSPTLDRFRLHIDGDGTNAFMVKSSTDMVNWTDVFLSMYGASVNLGLGDQGFATTFYRKQVVDLTPSINLQQDLGGGISIYLDAPYGDPYSIQYSTNQVNWIELAANIWGGPMFYYDWDAVSGPPRYYRAKTLLVQPVPRMQPPLGDGVARMETETYGGQPYVIQGSSNGSTWIDLYTNSLGGYIYYEDAAAPANPGRTYRVKTTTGQYDLSSPPSETLTQLHFAGLGGAPYFIQLSSDQISWLTIASITGGGPMDIVDSRSAGTPTRFYRVTYQLQNIRGDK